MFGFVLGTACLIGLFVTLRKKCRRHHHGCHGDHAHAGPPWSGGWRAWGPENIASWICRRVDATPEQRRVIRNEIDALFDSGAALSREFRWSRDDIAKAMRTDHFDEEIMGESFARQDDRIKDTRATLVGALAKIHDILDERQRRRFADMLERGWYR